MPSIYSLGNRLRALGTSLGNSFTTLHPRLFNRLYQLSIIMKARAQAPRTPVLTLFPTYYGSGEVDGSLYLVFQVTHGQILF